MSVSPRGAFRWARAVTVALALLASSGCDANEREPESRAPDTEELAMSTQASGTFDVTITPEDSQEEDGIAMGRSAMEKRFEGDLEGSSVGTMLTAMTSVEGSAGYVALERVSGTLHGRSGTFVLQHSGTMDRGEQWLSVTVVPDSGTGDLTGLAGTMNIEIVEGEHSYTLGYSLDRRP